MGRVFQIVFCKKKFIKGYNVYVALGKVKKRTYIWVIEIEKKEMNKNSDDDESFEFSSFQYKDESIEQKFKRTEFKRFKLSDEISNPCIGH